MIWLLGINLMRNDLHRRQLGQGAQVVIFDLDLITQAGGT